MMKRRVKRAKIDTKANLKKVGYAFVCVCLALILTMASGHIAIGMFAGLLYSSAKEIIDYFRCGRLNTTNMFFGVVGSLIGAGAGAMIFEV